MHGHDHLFETTNYNLTTTPEKEYKITTGQLRCPEQDRKDMKGKAVRVVRRIDDLMKLEVSRKAKLMDLEIIAVVRCVADYASIHVCPWQGNFVCFQPPLSFTVLTTNDRATGPLFRPHVSGVCPILNPACGGCRRMIRIAAAPHRGAGLQRDAAAPPSRHLFALRAGRQQVRLVAHRMPATRCHAMIDSIRGSGDETADVRPLSDYYPLSSPHIEYEKDWTRSVHRDMPSL